MRSCANCAQLGLGILYMGLETGDDATLKAIRKGADAATQVAMGRKAIAAGMKLSVTVILGIAGRARSAVHARDTARVLSEIDPDYVGALSLMLIPGTPLYEDWRTGAFELLDPIEMLAELRTLIAETRLSQGALPREPRLQLPADQGPAAQGPRRGGGRDRPGAGGGRYAQTRVHARALEEKCSGFGVQSSEQASMIGSAVGLSSKSFATSRNFNS